MERETLFRRPLRYAGRALPPAAVAGVLATALLAGCAGSHGPATLPKTTGNAGAPIGRGMASWYGPGFESRRTASGERYDMHGMTAAHPSFPFGTLVQVTNVRNGRQVVVRINDRGPFSKRRVIDLSYAAARELGMLSRGTAEVELAIAGRDEAPPPAVLLAANPPPSPAGAEAPAAGPDRIQELRYTVQIGAFGDPERAAALQREMATNYPEAAVRSDGTWSRVQLGLFPDREQAESLRRELMALGVAALIVAAPAQP
ncbi:MAG TPA: septal ring lytic transglycosylase RlpA family protein [Thermoanaerobaculia bacterium]|nr:septal ring lytic transglycosylase RlpA family protein [Thermoanaerobaculia bacterium]